MLCTEDNVCRKKTGTVRLAVGLFKRWGSVESGFPSFVFSRQPETHGSCTEGSGAD